MAINQNIDTAPLKSEPCQNKDCKCIFFKRVYLLKRVPMELTGANHDRIEPTPIYICEHCNQVQKYYEHMIKN